MKFGQLLCTIAGVMLAWGPSTWAKTNPCFCGRSAPELHPNAQVINAQAPSLAAGRGQTAHQVSLPAIEYTVKETGLRNIILFIGDGMGFEQVKAAGMYLNGSAGTLSFESLPYQGEITTYSANYLITDSAAAATAIATGHKVNHGVISMALPGDGRELQTLLEIFQSRGQSTGLVSTTYATHATPAAFGAHEPSRGNYTQIAGDYLTQTRPNVLFGGGANGLLISDTLAAGYTVITNALALEALDANTETMVSGQFGPTHLPYEYDGLGELPHLSEMTTTALDLLDNDPDGFFLMVEGGRIDHAGHANDIQRNIMETIEFANSVQEAIDWAQGRTDTLILVTADHETGGLLVLANNGQGNWPSISWSTNYHTPVNVPIYAWGVNAQRVNGRMDNTDVFDVVTRIEIIDLEAVNDGPTLLGNPTWLTASISAGSNVSYTWAFGDQELGLGKYISHTFPAAGFYPAVLTASNSLGQPTTTTPVSVFAPIVNLESTTTLIPETALSAPITVSLEVAPALTATVDYATADGSATAGEDYAPISGTLVFSPGVTCHSLWVPLIDDTQVEFHETIIMTLSNPSNLELGHTLITLTLFDDDNYKSYLPFISQGR